MPVPIYGDPLAKAKAKKADDCKDIKMLDTYIKRATNIMTQLNTQKNKDIAKQRLQLMSVNIQSRIDKMIADGVDPTKHTVK